MKIKISACTAKGSHIENQDCLCATGLCPEQTSFWADRKEVEVPFLYAAVSDGIGSGAASQYLSQLACETFAKAVDGYINYYNNERIQEKTKWMPPTKFREASMCT